MLFFSIAIASASLLGALYPKIVTIYATSNALLNAFQDFAIAVSLA